MFGLSRLQTQLITSAAIVAAIIALVVWLRMDAANDRQTELENKNNEDRLGHIEDSKGTRNEIEGLTDDNLGAALCRILSTPAECERRRSLQGREPAAAEGTGRDD